MEPVCPSGVTTTRMYKTAQKITILMTFKVSK